MSANMKNRICGEFAEDFEDIQDLMEDAVNPYAHRQLFFSWFQMNITGPLLHCPVKE